jgi:hypothetical protein
MKNAVFWNEAPCRSCINRRFGETYRLHLQGRRKKKKSASVSKWVQTSLYMDAIRSSETSVYAISTRCDIPEGGTLHYQIVSPID